MAVLKYAKGEKPKWRDILDSEKYPKWIGHIKNFIPVAKSVGYTLVCFNELIWEIADDYVYQTGWSAEEIDE